MYIFTVDLTREIVKKMISLKGDLIVGESIPIVLGIKFKVHYILHDAKLNSSYSFLASNNY